MKILKLQGKSFTISKKPETPPSKDVTPCLQLRSSHGHLTTFYSVWTGHRLQNSSPDCSIMSVNPRWKPPKWKALELAFHKWCLGRAQDTPKSLRERLEHLPTHKVMLEELPKFKKHQIGLEVFLHLKPWILRKLESCQASSILKEDCTRADLGLVPANCKEGRHNLWTPYGRSSWLFKDEELVLQEMFLSTWVP